MSPSHDAMRELVAVHALDALETEETVEVESHLAACSSCRQEFDDHRSVASLIGSQSVEADVPESLWKRVRAEITPLPPVELASRRFHWLMTAGAAAAMLVLVVVQTARLAAVETELIAAQDRLASIEGAIASGNWSELASIAAATPGARRVAMTGESTATITLLPDGTGFITASDLAELPADLTYQLWIVQRGEAVSAGLLADGAIGSVFRFDPDTLEGLVVTAEEAAGVVVSDGPAIAAWFDT